MAHIEFTQSTGNISCAGDQAGFHIGFGWAGNHKGKNNPALQDQRCLGPLPCGWYTIEEPISHPRLGPFAMHLIPDPGNEMFGRSDFWIHGASMNPMRRGQESLGCICAARPIRERIWKTSHRLQVVP